MFALKGYVNTSNYMMGVTSSNNSCKVKVKSTKFHSMLKYVFFLHSKASTLIYPKMSKAKTLFSPMFTVSTSAYCNSTPSKASQVNTYFQNIYN